MLLRRIPIDFRAIAAETGCTRGTVAHNAAFGWHVRNGNGPANFCLITPPPISPGETLKIEGRHWCIYATSDPSDPTA